MHEVLRELLAEIKKRHKMGFDVVEAQYYTLSALYHYRLGHHEKARELITKANELLEDSEQLPTLPERNWSVVDSNVEVARIPTVWDFVPIGTVFVKTKNGYLAYPRNDKKWKLSCFIMIAIGQTDDGQQIFYQGRLPLMPEENPFKPRIYINGEWVIPELIFVGPLYFDEGEKFGLPTVYQYDLSGDYMQTLSYDQENRVWIHTIESVRDERIILKIKARTKGVPMWLGEWNGSFIVHGVYARTDDFDLWGGFWDVGDMEMTLSLRGKTYYVKGVFIFDRASHRTYLKEKSSKMGSPLSFSCIVIYQDNLAVMITHSTNPSPLNIDNRFEHQLRINIFSLNMSIATTDFELYDDNSLQPSNFTLIGHFNGGYFNLTGYVIEFWPEKWVASKGTWWNSEGYYTWGRAFILWRGEIVVENKTIAVNAWGAGEFTRYGKSGAETKKCDVNGFSCWGRWSDNGIEELIGED